MKSACSSNIYRVDAYNNHVVLVGDCQGLCWRVPSLPTPRMRLTTFANLMASFRAYYAPGSSGTR